MSIKPYVSETKAPPCSPSSLPSSPLACQIEFDQYSNQYQRILGETQSLMRKITSMKIYCCDEYEVYSGCNTNWLNNLDKDKLTLSLNAAALEQIRIDVLQWAARARNKFLPAEIIRQMYALILASKYQGQECPWTKVNEQYRFDIMISASGVSFNRYDDIASHQSGPSPSLRPITDISESGVPDYTHVLRFNSAPNSEDERYQTDRKEDFSLEDALLIDPSPDPGLALEIEGDQSKNESARQHITPAPDDSVSADFSRYIKRPQICVKKLLLNNVKPDQIIGAGAQCRDKQERIAKRRLSETENESSLPPTKQRRAPFGG